MDISKLSVRACTRIEIIVPCSDDINEVLLQLRFTASKEHLIEVNSSDAEKILHQLIQHDIVFRRELTDAAAAAAQAKSLINELSDTGSRYYTNGLWHESRSDVPFSFHPFTASTFDGGIIIINKKNAACVWFEDDDDS